MQNITIALISVKKYIICFQNLFAKLVFYGKETKLQLTKVTNKFQLTKAKKLLSKKLI